MPSIHLTPDQSAHIQQLIDSFPGHSSDTISWLLRFVTEHNVLPLYVGWTETTGLFPDGRIVAWSTENECRGVRAVDDQLLVRASLVEAVKRYPTCEFLTPQRPANAVDCDACDGTAVISQLPNVICQCGGVGWIDAN